MDPMTTTKFHFDKKNASNVETTLFPELSSHQLQRAACHVAWSTFVDRHSVPIERGGWCLCVDEQIRKSSRPSSLLLLTPAFIAHPPPSSTATNNLTNNSQRYYGNDEERGGLRNQYKTEQSRGKKYSHLPSTKLQGGGHDFCHILARFLPFFLHIICHTIFVASPSLWRTPFSDPNIISTQIPYHTYNTIPYV